WAKRLVGQKLSHYKIGPVLAKGKTGYVFHAGDTRKNLAVALKVLDPRFAKNATAVQRFVRAMKTVLPLRHANIVTFSGAGPAESWEQYPASATGMPPARPCASMPEPPSTVSAPRTIPCPSPLHT